MGMKDQKKVVIQQGCQGHIQLNSNICWFQNILVLHGQIYGI